MTRALLLAVALQVTSLSSAGAQTLEPAAPAPPEPAMSAPDGPTSSVPGPARPGRRAQPESGEPGTPESGTAPPPADVPPANGGQRGPDDARGQTFEDEPQPPEPDHPERAREQTPRDIQSFADATMDARRLRFALNAFGDASLIGRLSETGDDRATFSLGTLALLINGQLGGSLLGTAEVAFDASSQNQQDIDLERLQLRWQTQHFFVMGGRMHTDLGYWNTAFHHGAWLHLPIARPRVLRGEDSGGGILPIHWIGIEGGAMLPVAPGVLTIGGGVGNGRGVDEQDLLLKVDSNNFKALRFKVEYLGLGLPDLRVGAGAIYDEIPPRSAEDAGLDRPELTEVIGNVYTAYRGVQLTVIAEAYSIWHRSDDDTTTITDAFIVAGYRIGRVTPYLMAERTDTHGETDPFYVMEGPDGPISTVHDETDLLAGARFDISIWSALKFEYGMWLPDDSGADHTIMINWSFGI